MYKDHGLKFWEHYVGATRQISNVEAVAKASGVKSAADDHFRLSVTPPDPTHIETATLRTMNVFAWRRP